MVLVVCQIRIYCNDYLSRSSSIVQWDHDLSLNTQLTEQEDAHRNCIDPYNCDLHVHCSYNQLPN
jgi:hypothetical protein